MPESPAAQSAYEVLGVSATATDDELRRAYRVRLRETHPDTGGDAVRFHAVQIAWEQVGTAADRAAYNSGSTRSGRTDDRGPGFAPPATSGAGAARGAGSGGSAGASVKARSYGHPGGEERERYLTLLREWVGRGVEIADPYDPALVRSAPREIRGWLAKAIAEEETARIVSTLGIGFTVWNNVEVSRTGSNVDHVVLGPGGLVALQSYDWGSAVRLSKGELIGDEVEGEPLRDLSHTVRALGKSLGVRFSGVIIVVPDDDLAAPFEQVERGRQAGAVVVRRSLLPQLLRSGVSGGERESVDRIFELRSRLQQSIRFV